MLSELSFDVVAGSVAGACVAALLCGVAAHRARTRAARRNARTLEQAWGVLQQVGQPIVYLDLQQRIIFANAHLLQMTGRTVSEVAGRRWTEVFVPGELREKVETTLSGILTTDEFVASGEYPIVGRDGARHPVRWRRSRVRDADGRVIGMASLGEDIAATRFEVERVARVEAFHRRILDAIEAGVIVTDGRDRTIYVNPVIRKTWPDIAEQIREIAPYGVLPQALASLRAVYAEARATRSPRTIESVVLHGANGPRTYTGSIVPLQPENGGGEMLCTLHDVTETVDALHALRSSTRLFESVVESVPGIVFSSNPETLQSDYVSAQAKAILGYTVEECMAPGFWESAIHPDDRRRVFEECVMPARRGEVHSIEYRIVRADGQVLWVHDSIRVVMKDGRPVKIYGVMTDITEYKAEQERARVARDLYDAERRRVEEADRVARLLTGVAHEVRNPLNSIQAAVAALELNSGGNAEDDALFTVVRSQVERLVRLMKNLLVYGKPAHASTIERCGVQSLLAGAVAVWVESSAAGEAGSSRVVLDIDVGDAEIFADPTRVQQVIVNVLDNAAQHDPSGGPIEVRARRDEGETKISVRDRGAGIPREVLPRIFEPFFTTRRGGTGLGLSIVRTVIEEHCGTIELRNNDDGPGCVAEIFFPIAHRERQEEMLAAQAVGR